MMAPSAARSFCDATKAYGPLDKGTPGAPNSPCAASDAVERCVDPESSELRPIDAPKPGDLVVSEIMAHSKSVPDAVGEWFEVLARRSVDLNALELANEGTGKSSVVAERCLRVEAGDHVVFARQSDASRNGGLPPILGTFGFALANTGTRAVVLRRSGVVVDRATYATPSRGVSLQRSSADGSALDGDHVRWCAAPPTLRYGSGDRWTPGAENAPCEPDPPSSPLP